MENGPHTGEPSATDTPPIEELLHQAWALSGCTSPSRGETCLVRHFRTAVALSRLAHM